MGIWNGTLAYVGARTLLAAAMIALLLRRRVGIWYAGGQVVSDLCCAAFLLGYVNPDIRSDLGAFAVPLLLFVLYWEATLFLERRRAAAEDDGGAQSWLDTAWHAYGAVWALGFVFPALLAGGFLMLDLIAPGGWPFPNPRPPLACSPRVLHPGTALSLRMTVPHGAELTVFPPHANPLVVVPAAARGTPPGNDFRFAERYVIAADSATGRAVDDPVVHAGDAGQRVFTDSGVYIVVVSPEAELATARVCRVRYGP